MMQVKCDLFAKIITAETDDLSLLFPGSYFDEIFQSTDRQEELCGLNGKGHKGNGVFPFLLCSRESAACLN